MIRQIDPKELRARLADPSLPPPLLLDVREPWEFEYCHIDGSILIPLGQIPARCSELASAREIVVICHHGIRSQQAARFLEHAGCASVYNLRGGIDAWSRQVDLEMRKY